MKNNSTPDLVPSATIVWNELRSVKLHVDIYTISLDPKPDNDNTRVYDSLYSLICS